MNNLNMAIDLACKGIHVHPCRKDKKPYTEHGLKDATTDLDIIRSWWEKWPDALVGVNCGKSGLVVVDIDDPNTIEKIMIEYPQWLDTRRIRTGSGGMHLYYNIPHGVYIRSVNRGIEGLPGVDIKSQGGYVIAAGTSDYLKNDVRCGGPYIVEDDCGPEQIPGDLLIMLVKNGIAETNTTSKPIEHKHIECKRKEIVDYEKLEKSAQHYLNEAICRASTGNRNEIGYKYLATQLAALTTAGYTNRDAERKMIEYQRSVNRASNPYTEREALASLKQAMKSPMEPAIVGSDKDNLKMPTYAPSDPDITIEATQILEHGNPMEFLRETVNEYHVGDEQAIRTTIISLVCSSAANSAGVNPAFVGDSGKGKSDLARAVAHIAPPGKILDTSLSPMALFYASESGEIQPGTIILSDDTELTPEMRVLIKRCTTNYQRETPHRTVIKGRAVILKIPPLIGWWITSVTLDDCDQVLNRQIPLDVDASYAQDERVFMHQLKLLETGESQLPESRRVYVARELLRIVCDGIFQVSVPYASRIEWNNKQNRRNFPVFQDILRCYAVLNRFQRKTDGSVIIADIADFEAACALYCSRAETQADKFTETERRIDRYMIQQGEATLEEIGSLIGKSETQTRYIMMGRDGNGGLLAKRPGLAYEKQTITDTIEEGTKRGRPKKVFILSRSKNSGIIQSYENVVYLKPAEK